MSAVAKAGIYFEEIKTEKIEFLAGLSQKQSIKAQAKKLGVSMGAYLRYLAIEAPLPKPITYTGKQKIQALLTLGRELNQVAKRLNEDRIARRLSMLTKTDRDLFARLIKTIKPVAKKLAANPPAPIEPRRQRINFWVTVSDKATIDAKAKKLKMANQI